MKLKAAVALMVLAILAIAFFQAYWLYKTYHEEEESLNIRANVLFRESVFRVQAAGFTLDSTGGLPVGVEAIRVMNNIKKRAGDFIGLRKRSLVISVDSGGKGSRHTRELPELDRDSMQERRIFSVRRNGNVYYDVLGVDRMQASISVADLKQQFKDALQREKIEIPFMITKDTSVSDALLNDPALELSNEVLVGLAKPVLFRLQLLGKPAYLLRKITPQIIVSVLLVTLTCISFYVLLRNLVQQRKLTDLKNDFISNITHELKTPIATVSVAIEAMKNFNALEDPKRTQEYLSISANELQRLSMLVDKVLKLSMFEKQEIELKKETFDIKRLVEEVTSSMRLQFEKSHATITMQLPDEETPVMADRVHMTSVIYNLLDNALKYCKGVPSILIELSEKYNEVRLSVGDNGIGISPEFQDKIFEKFFRVPTGDQHNVKGYGLGLSYVNYVIQRHKGNIQVESQPGGGSKFIITIPKPA